MCVCVCVVQVFHTLQGQNIPTKDTNIYKYKYLKMIYFIWSP